MTGSAYAVLAAEGQPSPLLPHTSEIIVGLIAFGLLYFFLSRKVFPILERTFRERQQAIEGGIQQAEQAQAEAQRSLEEYRAMLGEARAEAAQIRTQAQADRQAIVAEARNEAQAAAQQVTERAQAQIAADAAQARRELSRDVGRIAVDLAGRIVGENLDGDRTRRTVDAFIADLEAAAQPAAAGDGRGPSGGATAMDVR